MPVDPLVRRHVDRSTVEFVVFVLAVPRGDAIERSREVAEQQRLGLVEDESRSGVEHLQVQDSEVDARPRDDPLEPIGDVDELLVAGRWYLYEIMASGLSELNGSRPRGNQFHRILPGRRIDRQPREVLTGR